MQQLDGDLETDEAAYSRGLIRRRFKGACGRSGGGNGEAGAGQSGARASAVIRRCEDGKLAATRLTGDAGRAVAAATPRLLAWQRNTAG